jgi:translation initiation factor 1
VSKRRPPDPEPAPPASLGTLGDLLARHGVQAGAPPPPPPSATSRGAAGSDLARCGRIVVRRERKGHGGKTVTVVAGLGLAAPELERLARALRRALGCGAGVDGDRLVVQGDQTPRVQAWLAAQGVRRIVLGN